jgi:transcriptional regulator with XRE-family HTH domain
MDEDFAAKLTLVLKALSMSRGQLAAGTGVDKSLVGRWCAGTITPSGHNLARLTQTIALHHAGFTMIDWERGLASLAQLFGVTVPGEARSGPADALVLSLSPALAATARAHAAAYEGIWRMTYSAGVNEAPGMFVYSYCLLRCGADGLLRFKAGMFDVVLEGWATTTSNQFYGVAVNPARGTISQVIMNSVAGTKAMLCDGIMLSCRDGMGGTPMAAACVSERFADLTGDRDADDARYAALLRLHPAAPTGAVPEAIRNYLLRDTGPSAAAAGGDLLLFTPHLRSLARNAGLDSSGAPESHLVASG